jgi:hypothetical protein
MFKPGDRIMCVDNSDDIKTYEPYKNLKKYKTYTIKEILIYTRYAVRLIEVDGSFNPSRFISTKEQRKLKLKKLYLNQEIK